jgi:hypothetical protein
VKSPWTPSRDKRLKAYLAAGLSAAEAAVKLGTTRNAVIGRSIRLRGIVYQSSIDSWKRANAKRRKGPRKPDKMRRKALRDMLRNLAHGMPRNEAIAKASAAAYLREIGAHFGLTRQAVHLAAKVWKQRSQA